MRLTTARSTATLVLAGWLSLSCLARPARCQDAAGAAGTAAVGDVAGADADDAAGAGADVDVDPAAATAVVAALESLATDERPSDTQCRSLVSRIRIERQRSRICLGVALSLIGRAWGLRIALGLTPAFPPEIAELKTVAVEHGIRPAVIANRTSLAMKGELGELMHPLLRSASVVDRATAVIASCESQQIVTGCRRR